MTDEEKTRLTAVLGNYPHTQPLKRGEVTSPRLALDFIEMKPTNTAFKPMVRELRYDVSEMAIVTFLQAKAYGKPLVLLPTAMLSRFQQPHISYNAERGELKPQDLRGRRVGVRSYSQTTGVWIRGILAEEYGVEPEHIHWVTFEDAHVAEYSDPAGVERAGPDKKLLTMLYNGELDAVIGEFPNEPTLRPVIPDPAASAKRWYERHRAVPVNHMVVVKESLAQEKPWVIGELYRLLGEGKRAAPPAANGIDMIPFGIEANRRALALIIDYSLRQRLIPRRFSVDELFSEEVRRLAT